MSNVFVVYLKRAPFISYNSLCDLMEVMISSLLFNSVLAFDCLVLAATKSFRVDVCDVIQSLVVVVVVAVFLFSFLIFKFILSFCAHHSFQSFSHSSFLPLSFPSLFIWIEFTKHWNRSQVRTHFRIVFTLSPYSNCFLIHNHLSNIIYLILSSIYNFVMTFLFYNCNYSFKCVYMCCMLPHSIVCWALSMCLHFLDLHKHCCIFAGILNECCSECMAYWVFFLSISASLYFYRLTLDSLLSFVYYTKECGAWSVERSNVEYVDAILCSCIKQNYVVFLVFCKRSNKKKTNWFTLWLSTFCCLPFSQFQWLSVVSLSCVFFPHSNQIAVRDWVLISFWLIRIFHSMYFWIQLNDLYYS